MKVCVPQGLVAGFRDPRSGQLYQSKTGILDVPDRIGTELVKHNDCWPASGRPLGATGFVCDDCGFHAYFRTCGRCGGTCRRPHERTADHGQEAA